MRLGALAVCLAGAAQAAPVRRALVIGNAVYAALPPLPACASSARVVGAALRRAGFAVTEAADLSNGEMGSAVAGAGGADDAGIVVYICGYAADYGGRMFLLPASADVQRDTDVLTQGLTASSVIRGVGRPAGEPGVVLLDVVDAPKAAGVVHFETLASAAGAAGVGLSAFTSVMPPPQGATRLAAAISAALSSSATGARALVGAVAVGLPGAGPALTTVLPAAPAAAPAVAPAAAAMPEDAQMTEADRRVIQAALLRLGYYDKPVDGVFGADTRAAIRRFQHEIGADMTGVITSGESAKLLSK